jgi:hypothetical protein
MSQSGPANSSGSGAPPIETLTGNSGGPVGPDATFNIDLLGNNTTGIDIVGNAGLNTLTVIASSATTTQRGTTTLATNAETIAGTNTTKIVTPDDLKAKLGTQTNFGLPIGAGTASAISWTAAPTNGQILIGASGLSPVLNTITAGAGISVTNGSGTITIANTGGTGFTYTLVNASPYVVLPADQYMGVDCSGGAITIQLPNAPTTGRVFAVKDRTGSSRTNNITVTTVGGAVNIDGATTYVMASAYQAIELIFNGTFYEVF